MQTTLEFENPDEGIVKILQDLAPIGAEISESQVIERFKEVAGESRLPLLNHTLKLLEDEGVVSWNRSVSVKIVAMPRVMPEEFWDDTEGK